MRGYKGHKGEWSIRGCRGIGRVVHEGMQGYRGSGP